MKLKLILLGERPMSWNKFYSGMHWSKRDAEVTRVHQLIRSSLTGSQLKMINWQYPVAITMTIYFKNRPQDASNICAKLYEDGLVLAKIIKDDNPACVISMTTISKVDKDNPRLEVEICD